MSIIRGFEPIASIECRVLILGSMPSITSLSKAEYYGHPQNAFWPLVSSLLGEYYCEDYELRKQMLLKNRIALWDVAAACERDGSSDAAINNVTVNDFQAFYSAHPNIRQIFFNGNMAYALYRKHVGMPSGVYNYHRLGSTSPAHAIPFEKRLEDWARLLNYI